MFSRVLCLSRPVFLRKIRIPYPKLQIKTSTPRARKVHSLVLKINPTPSLMMPDPSPRIFEHCHSFEILPHMHLAKTQAADSLGIKIITKKNGEEPTTPDGGDGRTESPSGMYGAFSIGVSLLPDGGRDDSPSDW